MIKHRTLKALRKEASKAVNFRGHRMHWKIIDTTHYPPRVSMGTCFRCGMIVTCNTHPDANDIEIGGQAVALNCPATKPHHYTVVVGNVGTVYSGPNTKEAIRCWNEYVSLSKRQQGRAAGEDVTLLSDDSVLLEHRARCQWVTEE